MRQNLIILSFLAFIIPVYDLRADSSADDIRVLIDVSGSMKKSDPANLRIPAMKMLNGLIPNGSNAGVWTFGRYVNETVKWGRVDDRWRKKADSGVLKIHSNGLFTNIERALERASRGWGKADLKTKRSIILLTDGRIDISKDASKNEKSLQRVLTKRISKLVQQGVKVHTIALSKNTDEQLLKKIALDTGGSFVVAESAANLQKIFFNIFQRTTDPDMVEMNGNQFTVDSSIKEMTLLIFRNPGSKQTTLITPDKQRINAAKPGNSSWRSEQGYDLITIKKPKVGQWSIDGDVDPDNRVMVVTDLKLKLVEIPSYITPSHKISIRAELFNKDKKISKNSFLRFVEFNLEHQAPGQPSDGFKLKHTKVRKDKGQYFHQFESNLEEGLHSFEVSVNSQTFSRSKRIDIQVQWPVKVEIKSLETSGSYALSIKAREEYLKAGSLKPKLILESPDKQTQELDMEDDSGVWKTQIDTSQDGIYRALITISAENTVEKAIDLDLGAFPMIGVFKPSSEPIEGSGSVEADPQESEKNQEPAEIKGEQGSDWIQIAIIAGIVNLILILIVIGVVYFIRKKPSSADFSIEEGVADV